MLLLTKRRVREIENKFQESLAESRLDCSCGSSRVVISTGYEPPACEVGIKPTWYARCTVCGKEGRVASSRNVAALLWIQSNLNVVEKKELNWILAH